MEIFFLSFAAVFLAEIGDKTQFIALFLSSRQPARQVYLGTVAATAAVTLIAVTAGATAVKFLPEKPAAVGAGMVFLATGILVLLGKDTIGTRALPGRATFFRTFGLVFLAEAGDKSFVAALALVVMTGAPGIVFAGALAAHSTNHALGVFLGSRYLSKMPAGVLRISSAGVFFLFGIIFLLGVA